MQKRFLPLLELTFETTRVILSVKKMPQCRYTGLPFFWCFQVSCYTVLRKFPLNYSFTVKSQAYTFVKQYFIMTNIRAKSNFLEQHSCMQHIHECRSWLSVVQDKLHSCIGSYTSVNFWQGYTNDHIFANFHPITLILIPVDAPSKTI